VRRERDPARSVGCRSPHDAQLTTTFRTLTASEGTEDLVKSGVVAGVLALITGSGMTVSTTTSTTGGPVLGTTSWRDTAIRVLHVITGFGVGGELACTLALAGHHAEARRVVTARFTRVEATEG
jgi:hypothetical protein